MNLAPGEKAKLTVKVSEAGLKINLKQTLTLADASRDENITAALQEIPCTTGVWGAPADQSEREVDYGIWGFYTWDLGAVPSYYNQTDPRIYDKFIRAFWPEYCNGAKLAFVYMNPLPGIELVNGLTVQGGCYTVNLVKGETFKRVGNISLIWNCTAKVEPFYILTGFHSSHFNVTTDIQISSDLLTCTGLVTLSNIGKVNLRYAQA